VLITCRHDSEKGMGVRGWVSIVGGGMVSGNVLSGCLVVGWSHIALSLITGVLPRCGDVAAGVVLVNEQARRMS
jgi:hypothetical protein